MLYEVITITLLYVQQMQHVMTGKSKQTGITTGMNTDIMDIVDRITSYNVCYTKLLRDRGKHSVSLYKCDEPVEKKKQCWG